MGLICIDNLPVIPRFRHDMNTTHRHELPALTLPKDREKNFNFYDNMSPTWWHVINIVFSLLSRILCIKWCEKSFQTLLLEKSQAFSLFIFWKKNIVRLEKGHQGHFAQINPTNAPKNVTIKNTQFTFGMCIWHITFAFAS